MRAHTHECTRLSTRALTFTDSGGTLQAHTTATPWPECPIPEDASLISRCGLKKLYAEDWLHAVPMGGFKKKIIIRLFYYVGEGARALRPADSSKSKPWMHTERCELKPSLSENYFTVTSGTPRLGLLRSRCLNVFWMHPGESCAGRATFIKAASFLRKNLLN